MHTDPSMLTDDVPFRISVLHEAQIVEVALLEGYSSCASYQHVLQIGVGLLAHLAVARGLRQKDPLLCAASSCPSSFLSTLALRQSRCFVWICSRRSSKQFRLVAGCRCASGCGDRCRYLALERSEVEGSS